MFFLYAVLVLGGLTIAGVLADYVLPHIRPLERWITRLMDSKNQMGR